MRHFNILNNTAGSGQNILRAALLNEVVVRRGSTI